MIFFPRHQLSHDLFQQRMDALPLNLTLDFDRLSLSPPASNFLVQVLFLEHFTLELKCLMCNKRVRDHQKCCDQMKIGQDGKSFCRAIVAQSPVQLLINHSLFTNFFNLSPCQLLLIERILRQEKVFQINGKIEQQRKIEQKHKQLQMEIKQDIRVMKENERESDQGELQEQEIYIDLDDKEEPYTEIDFIEPKEQEEVNQLKMHIQGLMELYVITALPHRDHSDYHNDNTPHEIELYSKTLPDMTREGLTYLVCLEVLAIRQPSQQDRTQMKNTI